MYLLSRMFMISINLSKTKLKKTIIIFYMFKIVIIFLLVLMFGLLTYIDIIGLFCTIEEKRVNRGNRCAFYPSIYKLFAY